MTFSLTLALALITAATAGAEPASAWFLSPEPANSDAAGAAHTLYWIGLVVAVLAAGAVNLALVMLIRRRRATRALRPEPPLDSPRVQLRLGGALTGAVVVLLAIGVIFTEQSSDVAAAGQDGGEAVQITATGQQWLWRYDYPDGVYSYYKLTVPVDTRIDLDVLSTDVVHSWLVPAFGGAVDAVPGKRNTISFVADEEGSYKGRSGVFSGQAYPAMRTEVEVVSREAYDEFLERRAAETQEAQENAIETYQERQGEE